MIPGQEFVYFRAISMLSVSSLEPSCQSDLARLARAELLRVPPGPAPK
jgi:hypothetical protein